MAALGGGRLILANQGSLYHASWRPRLPNVFLSVEAGKHRQIDLEAASRRAERFFSVREIIHSFHLLYR